MIQEALPHLPSENGKVNNLSSESNSVEAAKSSTLIEFPGVTRVVPEWRKQLSQRVREVQERKAREAAEELAAAQEAGLVSCALPSGQLELVPDLENQAFNPIVTKALERLERARRTDRPSMDDGVTSRLERETEGFPTSQSEVFETKPKLTVVAPSAPLPSVESESVSELNASEPDAIEPIDAPTELQTETALPTTETVVKERKPVRVISDDDVALSYLESCLSVPALESDTRSDIPGLARRFFAGIVDVMLIAVLVSPAAVAIQFNGGSWSDPRIIGLMSGITALTMFVYLTFCTAMTGRTLAKRMFSLRTIDLRTGMIPTGGQSITRALGFVLSFALLGLGLAYALIDRDGRTLYDRLSKTLVVRA